MISIASQFGQVAYNVVKLILDSTDDLVNLPTGVKPGSTAFVISTSETWMMNSKGEWKKIKTGSGGNSGDSSGDSGLPDTDGDGVPDYDGGIIT